MVMMICCGKEFKVNGKDYMCDLPVGHGEKPPKDVFWSPQKKHQQRIQQIHIREDGTILGDYDVMDKRSLIGSAIRAHIRKETAQEIFNELDKIMHLKQNKQTLVYWYEFGGSSYKQIKKKYLSGESNGKKKKAKPRASK